MTQTIALTGGTGFIGRSILTRLLAAGHQVRLLARNPSKISLQSERLQLIRGSLHEHALIEQLVDHADTIIHCAGRVRGRRLDQFTTDNLDATEGLITANKSRARFVYISSLAAREPSLSHYALSKNQAEQAIRAHQTTNWTILRPPAVYGPGDRELRPLFDWMRRGVMWVPGLPSNRFSLLHVNDLASLVQYIVEHNHSTAQIVEPDDGKVMGYQWSELQAIAAHVFKRKIRRYTLPTSILNPAARANMVFSTLINKAPMLTLGKVRELQHSNWVVDSSKSITGWQAQIDFEAGLRILYSLDH